MTQNFRHNLRAIRILGGIALAAGLVNYARLGYAIFMHQRPGFTGRANLALLLSGLVALFVAECLADLGKR